MKKLIQRLLGIDILNKKLGNYTRNYNNLLQEHNELLEAHNNLCNQLGFDKNMV